MSTVISVENLSKKYTLRHQNSSSLHLDLRDELTEHMKAVGRKILHPFRSSSASLPAEEFWALNDVSFEVKQGDRVGIIGRNGAGKSTLLKILSRITEPTAGRVKIKGRVASLLEVGTGFHPDLTGRENIFLNGAILGMSHFDIKRKFDEIVAFAEIDRFLDTPVKRYSSGMYVRLAFAVAAHLEPEILLIDEVLAVGDIEFQRKCMGKVESVSKSGSTVLFISHGMSTIKALCSKSLLLDSGFLLAYENSDIVISKYMNLNKADESEKIITENDHKTGVNQILVKKISLNNISSLGFRVFWKEKICISVEIKVLKSVREVAFGAGIRTIDGTHAFTVHHDDNNYMGLWNFEIGEYAIRFELENNLRPGLYKLHIGADQGHTSIKNICFLDAVNLEVLDHSIDGSVPLENNTGIFVGNSEWQTPERIS